MHSARNVFQYTSRGYKKGERTFLTECIPAVGHSHVGCLEGAMYWTETAKGWLIRHLTYYFFMGQRDFSSVRYFVKWVSKMNQAMPVWYPTDTHLVPHRCLHSKSVTNYNSWQSGVHELCGLPWLFLSQILPMYNLLPALHKHCLLV